MSAPEEKLDSKVLPLPRPRLEVEAEKPSPSRAEELRERGDGRYESDDYVGALEDYTAAIALDPDNRSAYLGRALASHALGDYPAAIRDNSKAISLRPSPVAYYNRAVARLRDGDEEGARADFKNAPDVLTEEARAHCETEPASRASFEKALYYLDIVVDVQPDRFEAIALRGLALHKLSRHAEAVRDYSAALALQSSPNVLFSRGTARYVLNDLPGALADLDAAIALRSTDKDFFWHRGLVKERLGDASGAFADFTRFLGGPSEEQKRAARADIREHRSMSRRYAAGATVAWILGLAFRPELHGDKAGRNFWIALIGIAVIGGLFSWATDEELLARGYPEEKLPDEIEFLFIGWRGLFGPLAWAAKMYSVSKGGTRCRTCSTNAGREAVACRRCGTPLTADE